MRPIFAARLVVSARPGDPAAVYDRVVALAHQWLVFALRRQGVVVAAGAGESFRAGAAGEGGVGGGDAVRLGNGSLGAWRGTVEQPVAGAATGRLRSEIQARQDGAGCCLTLRVLAEVDGTAAGRRIEIDRPPLIPALLDAFAVSAGNVAMSVRPWRCSAPGVPGLARQLVDPGRGAPVVVVSRRRGGATALDAAETARRLAGIARVVVLADDAAAVAFGERLGRDLACFDGAVRIYWPGFALGDDRSHHSLWTAAALAAYAAPDEVPRMLLRRIAAVAAERIGPDPDVLAIEQASERARAEGLTHQLREAARTDEEWRGLVDLASAEIETLEARVADLERENARLQQAIAGRSSWRDAFAQTRQEGDPTETDRAESDAGESEPTDPPPSLAAAVQRAVERHGGPHVEFTRSAFETAAESPYRGRPERVYQALAAICEVAALYHADRLEQTFEDAFRERGQSYRRDVSPTALGQHGNHYAFVSSKGRIVVGPHLALGRGNPATSLRIYWYVDEAERRFYVCHVGRHLPDTTT